MEIVLLGGSRTAVTSGFEELADRIFGARKPRYIVVMDNDGYEYCMENTGRYPFGSVWLLLAVGNIRDFPQASAFVCASGKVISVASMPLPNDTARQMDDAIRAAGRTCTF